MLPCLIGSHLANQAWQTEIGSSQGWRSQESLSSYIESGESLNHVFLSLAALSAQAWLIIDHNKYAMRKTVDRAISEKMNRLINYLVDKFIENSSQSINQIQYFEAKGQAFPTLLFSLFSVMEYLWCWTDKRHRLNTFFRLKKLLVRKTTSR